MENSLPLIQIKNCFLMHNFKSEFERHKFKKMFSDVELFNFTIFFIKDICGIDVNITDVNSPQWYSIYKNVISPLVTGKITTEETPSTEVSILSPATAIYYSLFQLYKHEAPRKMYELLEPILVQRIAGNDNGAEFLFYPVIESLLDKQIAIVKEILEKEPQICNVPLFVTLFCSKSKKLSKNSSRKCISLLNEACKGINNGSSPVPSNTQ